MEQAIAGVRLRIWIELVVASDNFQSVTMGETAATEQEIKKVVNAGSWIKMPHRLSDYSDVVS